MRGAIIISACAIIWVQPSLAQNNAAANGPRPAGEFERLLNKDATSVMQILGLPVQDAQEGPARRLQFAGPACILDVYLYPPAEGAEPRVTYASARVADGREADRNLCITILRLQH